METGKVIRGAAEAGLASDWVPEEAGFNEPEALSEPSPAFQIETTTRIAILLIEEVSVATEILTDAILVVEKVEGIGNFKKSHYIFMFYVNKYLFLYWTCIFHIIYFSIITSISLEITCK